MTKVSIAISVFSIALVSAICGHHFLTGNSVPSSPLEKADGETVHLKHIETFDYSWPAELFSRGPARRGAVVFLGDSLTAGGHWEEALSGVVALPVLNRGLNGDTIEGVLFRLDEVLRHRPSKIFVMVGINDLRFEGDSPGNLSSAFRRLIERVATESPNTQIIVQSILPVWGNLNSQVLAANQALSGLAEGDRVVYLDIHSMFADGTGQLSKEFTFDGVHLRAVGYLKWRSAIMPFLVR